MEEKLRTLQQWINESERIVFFGGAGVSTESGIPDFRSVDGLYHQQYSEPPETILSHTYFMRRTADFYSFYRNKMLFPDAQPNAAHRKLAELEAAGKLTAVVTQNIDGLHQAAGSKTVYELHGAVSRNYFQRWRAFFSGEEVMYGEEIARGHCGCIIKSDVVLYEEALDGDTVNGAVRAIAQADMLIIGGTSLVVYPAASLIHYYKGTKLVLINLAETSADSVADLVIHAKVGEVLGQMEV